MLSPQAASLIPRDMIDELAVGHSNVDRVRLFYAVLLLSIKIRNAFKVIFMAKAFC